MEQLKTLFQIDRGEAVKSPNEITEVDEKLAQRWRNMEPRFWVFVIAPRYPHRGWIYKNVSTQLYHHGEASEKDAGSLLFGITDDPYVRSQVEETFTKGEVKQIRDYFFNYWRRPLKIRAKRAIAPRYNYIGVGALPLGGLVSGYMFSETPDYPLPFKIWGYVDLRPYRATCGFRARIRYALRHLVRKVALRFV
ncbi:hypothetical protein ES703_104645 [subsurface metagenome]